MFETGVEVGLRTQEHDVLEVGVVNVRVYAEEPLEYYLDDIEEVLRERHTEGAREDLLVVQLIFNPGHQKINVLLRAHLKRRLHIMAVGPQILVLGPCTHRGAGLRRAELCEDAV